MTTQPPTGRARDGDRALLERYRRDGDSAARDRLAERMLPLVRRLARRYQRGSEPLDDVIQAGCVGLVKAIERFDLERDVPFARFAAPNILGEIKRHFRVTGCAAHVPRGMQERTLELRRAVDELSAALGRSPTTAEMADELGIDTEDVVEVLAATDAYSAVSLDAPRAGEDGECDSYIDSLGGVDYGYVLVDDLATVLPALRVLPKRELLRLRFSEDLTQSEIAERLGISQMHVSRLLRRALERVHTITSTDRHGARDRSHRYQAERAVA